jgi:hypothetical protein
MKDPFKYQHKDQADLDSGRPLKYHTPAIKKGMARKMKLDKPSKGNADKSPRTAKTYD